MTSPRSPLQRIVRWLLIRALPPLDSMTLWCFGWQRVDAGMGMGRVHYRDPITGDLLLRDMAVRLICQRARRAI